MSLSQFFTLKTSCVSLTGHRSRPGEPRKLTAKLWLAALFLPLGFLWVRDPRYTDFRLKESTFLSLGKTEGDLFVNHTLSSNKCVCLLRNFKRSMKTKAPSRMNAVLVLDVQDIKKLTVSHTLCEKVWSCAPCMRVRAQRCPTLRDPMDCSLPGSSVHGISQARILEGVAISCSRGSSQPRDRTCVSCVPGWQADSLPLVPYCICTN